MYWVCTDWMDVCIPLSFHAENESENMGGRKETLDMLEGCSYHNHNQ